MLSDKCISITGNAMSLIFSLFHVAICQLCSIQKEVKSNPKTVQLVKKCVGHCEIQGGGQKMAVIVG